MISSLLEFVAAGKPLTDPKTDKLGRAPFAERVAREICANSLSEALIVGLNGEPGSGKTTL